VKRVLSFINHVFPNDNQETVEYIRGTPVELENEVRGHKKVHVYKIFDYLFNYFAGK